MSTCRVVRPPSTEACGAKPVFRVFWQGDDDPPTDACQDCVLHLKQIAQEIHVPLKIERLDKMKEGTRT